MEEEIYVEQTHGMELQSISDALRGNAAQGGIDREVINSLVEYSAALTRIAMLYDVALVEANSDAKAEPLRTNDPAYFKDGLKPKAGDWVRWRSNGHRWTVNAQDDLDNPGTALSEKEWYEDVIFEKRP